MREEHPIPALSMLAPGDLLLYDRPSFLGTAIKFKTWSDVSHVELVVDTTKSISARQEGVNEFPIDLHGLRYVLRPTVPILLRDGLDWFYREAQGQKYDYIGLFAFFVAKLRGKENEAQFCSEICARILKKCNVHLLHPTKDADTYAPSTFKDSPLVDFAWWRYVDEDWKYSTQSGCLVL